MSTKTEAANLARTNAAYELRETVDTGSIVYTVERSRTAGGTVNLSLFVLRNGDLVNITYSVGIALGMRPGKDQSRHTVVTRGIGLNLAFHVVGNLARALYNDEYALGFREL